MKKSRFSFSHFGHSFRFFYSINGNRMFALMGLSLVSGLLDSLGITLFFPLFLLLSEKAQATMGDNFVTTALADVYGHYGIPINITTLSLLVASVFLLKGALKVTEQYFKTTLGANMLYKLRAGVVDRFSKTSYRHFSSLRVGDITNVATGEVEKVVSGFLYFTDGLLSLVTAFAYIVFVFALNAQVSLLTIVMGAVFFAIFYVPTKLIRGLSTSISRSNSVFNNLLIQAIQGYKYLKSTASFDRIGQRVKAVANDIRKYKHRQGLLNSIVKGVQEPFTLLFVLAIVILQTVYYGIDIFEVLPVLVLFQRCFTYITTLQTQMISFANQQGAIGSVQSLYYQLDEYREPEPGKEKPFFQKELSIEGLAFGYTPDKTVLKDISLAIPKNGCIAFVGASGSGKSTLVDLITGVLAPIEGKILVDGQDLQQCNLEEWRRRIGFVSQDTIVFADTVENNLTLWEKPLADRISEALRKAHATDFVENFEQGLSTHLGDRGVKMSGGQRQRIAIARELYKLPELLILDEATSALDSEAEGVIKESIDELKGQTTIIMIAHRLSTVVNADCIYVLEKGELVEYGPYQELISNNGIFTRLVALQANL